MGGILLRGRRETPADIIMVKTIEGKGPDQGHLSHYLSRSLFLFHFFPKLCLFVMEQVSAQ